MRKLLLVLAVLIPVSAGAQDVSVRYQSQAISSHGLPLANQSVAICSQPTNTNTQPCSPLATLGTSTTTSTGGANPTTTDINGNFFFYTVPGKYTIQIFGPQVLTPFVQPDVNIGINGPGGTITGATTVTGALTAKNDQNIRYVSPTNLEGWAGANITAWANAAAADLAGPGTVYFRSGTYTVPTSGSGSIQLLSNVAFACTGFRTCTLNGPSFVAGDFFFFAAASIHDCYVGNFVMVGGSTSVDNRGITNNNGVNFTRCTFENNDISNTFDGIDVGSPSTDSTIQNNYIHSVGQQGITVNGSQNKVLFNRIDTVGTTNLHHGVYLQSGVGNEAIGNVISNINGFCITNFTNTTGGTITDSKVIGNHCVNGGLAASGTRGGIQIAETAPATGNRQGLIANNTIETTNGNPIQVSAATDVVVSGNTIRTYQGDGITIQGSTGVTTTRVTVTGNVVLGGSVSGNAIRIHNNSGNIQNIVVTDNVVDTAFASGIWLNVCTDCIVEGNRVKDYNVGAAFSNAGIRLDGTLRSRISGNSVTTANTTGAPPAIYLSDATSTDNQVYNNYVVTSLNGAAWSDGGTRTRAFGNHTQVTSGIMEVQTPFSFPASTLLPSAANTTDVGSAALPFVNLWLGTAATNNFKFQPAATSAARVVSIPDPGAAVNLAFNLSATSSAFATATTAGTCVQNTTAVTGAATTMVAEASPVSTPGVGAVWSAFVSSAGNVTINECAVATSAGGTIAFNIRVHP